MSGDINDQVHQGKRTSVFFPAIPADSKDRSNDPGGPMKRRLCMVLLGVAAALFVGTAAWAFWGSGGIGGAVAVTGRLNAPASATASAPLNSSTVAVGWSGAQLGTGQAATGYFVLRVRNSDGAPFPACGTSLSSPTAALSCNDLGVTDGGYHYTVTALFGSWTAVSPSSNSVTVVNDSGVPSVTVTSISPAPNGNGYNNTSPVVVNLSASGGTGIILSITYTIDSGSPVTVLGATAAVSVAGDGIHTVTYYATDTAVHVSETGSVFVRIDRVAPAAPSAPVLAAASDTGSSSADGITNVTTPVFTGTAETGSTVTLYDGATPVGTAVASGGAYTITSSTLAAGTKTMTAKATDPAGNTGPASAGTTITIDATAPAAPSAPVLTAASDSGTSSTDRITKVTTPVFTGTAETGATVTLYNGATAVGTAVATGGAYSVTSSALTTGAKTMTVKATDPAGNAGPASAGTTITIDITAPGGPGKPALNAANDTGRSATDGITKVAAPTFTGTATVGTTVTLYDGAAVLGSTTATASYSITSTALTNAAHSITAKATDTAGNVSVPSTAKAVTIDTTAPAAPPAPTLSAASDTGASNSDRITKTVTPIITGTNESKAIVLLYDGATQIGTKTTTGSSYSITSATLSSGSHTLTATATDTAGNTGTASGGTAITIDTAAPAAPSVPALTPASDTGISSTDGITKTATPALTGTAEAGTTVALFDTGIATGAAVTATGGTYTATTGTLAAGSHTIAATATDTAGNIGPSSSGTVVTIDTTAPAVTINQAAGQADPTTAATINFTVVFSENVYGLSSSGITFTGTAAATTATVTGSGTTFNVAVSGMTKTGTVIPKVAAAAAPDAAGNLNTISTTTDSTVTYTDATAPAVAINNFTPGPSQTATVNGIAGFGPGDSATVTVVLCTVNAFPCLAGNTVATLTPAVNPSTGAWSATTGALGARPALYARATQTDLTANTGQSPVAGPITVP